MTQRIGKYDLFFDGQGNMQRDSGRYSSGNYPVPNQPMRLKLQFISKSSTYSGSSYWTLEDANTGRKYPMFTSDVYKLILHSKIDHGVVEEREYIGIKKGNTYGVVPYTG